MKNFTLLNMITCFLLISLYSCNFKKNQSPVQNCNNHCKENNIVADSLYRLGNLKEAIKMYRTNYNKCNNEETAYSLAYCYAITQNRDSSFYYLNKAVKCDSSVYRLFKGALYYLINDPRWDSIVNLQINKYEAKFGHLSNKSLTKQLLQIGLKDQAYYYQIFNFPDSANYYWTKKIAINKDNLKKVEDIIKTYGWPKKSEVGVDASPSVFIVLQHSNNLDLMKKYLPQFKNLVDINEADGGQYALMIDRINLKEGKNQIYGSQFSFDSIHKKFYIDSVEDIKNLNRRRKEVGLQPIEEYLKSLYSMYGIKN